MDFSTSYPLLSPGVPSNSCTLSWWYRPTISSSVIPFSPCIHSFPGSESFSMSQLFASDGQNIGASALASVLPVNIQDWFPLGLTGLLSLQSWLSTFFVVQLSHPYLTTGKTIAFTIWTFVGKMSLFLIQFLRLSFLCFQGAGVF